MYRGLFLADPGTLEDYASRPDVLKNIYARSAGVFGAFGAAVRIRGDRVDVPGADRAVDIWQELVTVDVAPAAPFLKMVLEADNGRLAFFYHSLASLDAGHLAFALGLTCPTSSRGS